MQTNNLRIDPYIDASRASLFDGTVFSVKAVVEKRVREVELKCVEYNKT